MEGLFFNVNNGYVRIILELLKSSEPRTNLITAILRASFEDIETASSPDNIITT
jgi:hypothetical protein